MKEKKEMTKKKKNNKTKIIIGKWILYQEFNPKKFLVIDTTKLDVSEEELSLCVQEQIYGNFFNERRKK